MTLEEFKKKVSIRSPKKEHLFGKQFVSHPERSNVRYELFTIKRTGTCAVNGLKEHIEKQFVFDWSWNNFTFKWDVSPSDPLKVVNQSSWLVEGGIIDDGQERLLDGSLVQKPVFTPRAFTEQE